MKKYPSSLDQTSIVITYSIFILAIVIFIVSYFAYKRSGDASYILVMGAIGPVLLLVLTVAMYYLKPLSITLSDTSITIERKLKPVSINYSEIRSARPVGKDEMSFVIRTFGNGGLFGYTGLYYNKKFGSMTWYCTQRKNYIMITKQDNKQLVITPDDPLGFMKDLESLQPLIQHPASSTPSANL